MTLMVAETLKSVNHSAASTYRCHLGRLAGMETVADRVKRLLKEKKISGRELGRRAGFRTETQLGNTLRRLEEDPERAELKTVRRIARGLGVSSNWLLTGEGLPTDIDPSDDTEPEPYLRIAPEAPPLWRDLHNWTDLLVEAQLLDPKLEPWAWKHVAKEPPPEGAPRTAETVARMAKAYAEVVTPPLRPVPALPPPPPLAEEEKPQSHSRELPAPTKPPKRKGR